MKLLVLNLSNLTLLSLPCWYSVINLSKVLWNLQPCFAVINPFTVISVQLNNKIEVKQIFAVVKYVIIYTSCHSLHTNYGYKLNSHLTCFQWGFIAQSVEHIASVLQRSWVWIRLEPQNFFLGFICNCLKLLHNCFTRSLSLLFFIRSSLIWSLSYTVHLQKSKSNEIPSAIIQTVPLECTHQELSSQTVFFDRSGFGSFLHLYF